MIRACLQGRSYSKRQDEALASSRFYLEILKKVLLVGKVFSREHLPLSHEILTQVENELREKDKYDKNYAKQPSRGSRPQRSRNLPRLRWASGYGHALLKARRKSGESDVSNLREPHVRVKLTSQAAPTC